MSEIFTVYRDIVKAWPDKSLPDVVFLWGHDLASWIDEETEREITDRLVEMFERVLALRVGNCCLAEVHGLGHLSHPRKRAILEEFMRHGGLRLVPDAGYIQSCIDGTVM